MGHLVLSATIRRLRRHHPACQEMREPLPAPDVFRAAEMRCARLALAIADNGPSARNTQTVNGHRKWHTLRGSRDGPAAPRLPRRERSDRKMARYCCRQRPSQVPAQGPRALRRPHPTSPRARLTDTQPDHASGSRTEPFGFIHRAAGASDHESRQERRHVPVIVAGSGLVPLVRVGRSLGYGSLRCARPRFNSKPRAST